MCTSFGHFIAGTLVLGGAAFSLFMYHYASMSLYIVNIEKCRDKAICTLELGDSGLGFVVFLFQLLFLALTIALGTFSIFLCGTACDSTKRTTPKTESVKSAPVKPTTPAPAAKSTTDETTVELDTVDIANQATMAQTTITRREIQPQILPSQTTTNPFITTVELDEMI